MSHLFNPLSTHTRRRLTDLLGFGSSVVAAAVELFAGSNNLRYSILHSSIHLLSTSGCGGFFLQPLVILPLYFSNPYLTVNCATAAQPNECERTNGGGVECTTAKHPLEKERNNLTIMHLLLLFILPPEFPPSKLEELFFYFHVKALLHCFPLCCTLCRGDDDVDTKPISFVCGKITGCCEFFYYFFVGARFTLNSSTKLRFILFTRLILCTCFSTLGVFFFVGPKLVFAVLLLLLFQWGRGLHTSIVVPSCLVRCTGKIVAFSAMLHFNRSCCCWLFCTLKPPKLLLLLVDDDQSCRNCWWLQLLCSYYCYDEDNNNNMKSQGVVLSPLLKYCFRMPLKSSVLGAAHFLSAMKGIK